MEEENLINTKMFDYLINKSLYKTISGEIFIVLNKLKPDENILYIMKSIIVKSEEEKNELLNEIKKLKELNSKYLIKIHDYFAEKREKEEIINIIFEDFQEHKTLEELIYSSYFLTSQNIWRIFIKLLIGIISFHNHHIIINNLNPQNIFIDKKNNIKFGGIGNILDFSRENKDCSLYKNPEFFFEKKTDSKCVMWSLGCILYEMFFKKKMFDNSNNIISINYDLPKGSEEDIKKIIEKLICKHDNIIEAEELLYDHILKKKIIGENLFSEIISNNIKGKKISFFIFRF